jgi:SAM-dependent methyltransferase
MYLDVTELRDFYATLLGRIVARHVGRAILELARPRAGERVLGFGFPTPYLGSFRGRAERVLAFMPAAQGVMAWPPDAASCVALVEEDALPLPDASVDLLLLVHALEMSPQPGCLMGEARRVLAPAGRLLVVAPNRQGAWARFDVSPFGHGRPYSRGQLRALFAEAAFEPDGWTTALHMPPSGRRAMLSAAGMLEKAGRVGWPAFAGVICACAVKRTVQGARVRARRVLSPNLSPALRPSGGALQQVQEKWEPAAKPLRPKLRETAPGRTPSAVSGAST